MRKRREGVGWTAGTGAEREEGEVSCFERGELGGGEKSRGLEVLPIRRTSVSWRNIE